MVPNCVLTTNTKKPCVFLELESDDKKCALDKVDAVMWTKNSEKFLPLVLTRIEEVIPSDVIFNRIIIDDHSTDNTIEIAKKWDGPSTIIKETVFTMRLKLR